MKEQGTSSVLEAERSADSTFDAALKTAGGPAPSRDWGRRFAAVAVAMVLLAGATIVYWTAQDEPSHVGLPPLQTTDMSRAEILEDLINRGLIPSQTLDAAPRSRDEIIGDLVNRGLIPSQTLAAEPSN